MVLGGVFLATRLPSEVDRLGRFDSVDDVVALSAGTPAAAGRPRSSAPSWHPSRSPGASAATSPSS